ncbi:MAG: hypothetical protein M3R15_19560 [Acidobacteriota bacterium]|nr:hypothetical protein [Acidobacteriota bacterium]
MSNNLANEIAAKVAILPVEKQREVLQMVESLIESTTHGSQPQRRRLLESLEHLNITLTDADIQEARREMWGER